MKQVLLRLDDDAHTAFKAACDHHPAGMQGVLQRYVEAFNAHENTGQIRHMDGTLCPVSAMIEAIAASVHVELKYARERRLRPTVDQHGQ